MDLNEYPLVLLKPILEKLKKDEETVFHSVGNAIGEDQLSEEFVDYCGELSQKYLKNTEQKFTDEDFIIFIVYSFWSDLRWKRICAGRKSAKTRKKNAKMRKNANR